MSSPAVSLPRHALIGVREDGSGPVAHDQPEFDHFTCWCSSESRAVVVKFNSGNGLTLCPYTRKMIHPGFPPGWFDRQERES